MPPGWRACCTGSNIRDQRASSSTWPGWPRNYPGPGFQEELASLQKREAHMQYPSYQTAGWPIGSGSVESANKVVVESRLKGAGMRWQGRDVNPMLVLRNAVCNRRWPETWTIARAQRVARCM